MTYRLALVDSLNFLPCCAKGRHISLTVRLWLSACILCVILIFIVIIIAVGAQCTYITYTLKRERTELLVSVVVFEIPSHGLGKGRRTRASAHRCSTTCCDCSIVLPQVLWLSCFGHWRLIDWSSTCQTHPNALRHL